MKNLIALVTCTFLAFGAVAQDAEPVKERKSEIYVKPLGLFNFSGIQLEYKRQLKSGKYFTLGLEDLSIRHSQDLNPSPSTTNYNNNYSAGLSVGCERRKPVIKNLQLIHGLNLGLSYTYSTYITTYNPPLGQKVESGDYNSIYRLAPGYKVGLLYTIENKFLLGGQFIPNLGLSYHHSYQKQTPSVTPATSSVDRLDINFNVFNNSRLLIGYRF